VRKQNRCARLRLSIPLFVAALCTASTAVVLARSPDAGAKATAPASRGSGEVVPPPGSVRVSAPLRVIRLSAAEGGIGFDDLGFSAPLRKVLVPAGGSGRVDLIDPDSFAVTSTLQGAATAYAGGHDDGITSADSDGTRLFATDRTARRLLVVNPATGALLGSAALTGHPDYVRWVSATGELWVTEPHEERIEVFSLGTAAVPRAAGQIAIAGGPESLVIGGRDGRAFTNLWSGVTLALDVVKRSVVARWPNGCHGSRGIAFDEADGIVLAACAEGKLVALDAKHDGRKLGAVTTGAGVDVIAYAPGVRHAYVPAATRGEMAVIGVSPAGALKLARVVPTAKGSHCVAADDRGHAWVCDPARGQLLLFSEAGEVPAR
jgi:hypothetical protein